MAKRNVVWTKTADIQFVGILQYWVERKKSRDIQWDYKNIVKRRGVLERLK